MFPTVLLVIPHVIGDPLLLLDLYLGKGRTSWIMTNHSNLQLIMTRIPPPRTQSQLLEEKVRELSDCHDQLEVAREAEEEYERRLDEEQAKTRRKIHALEVKLEVVQGRQSWRVCLWSEILIVNKVV